MLQSGAHRLGLGLIMVGASMLGGCCCRSPIPASDKIESLAVVGFYSAPKTVLGSRRLPAETTLFEPVEVWVYLCFYNRQTKPVVGKEVSLSIVDGFGKLVPGPQVSSNVVTINEIGLNDVKLLFDPKGHAGVFRIRADYDDKQARAIGYSPPITVLSR